MAAQRFAFRLTRLACLTAVAVLYAAPALSGTDASLDALDLADNTEFSDVKDKTLNVMAEAASAINENSGNVQRVSLDMRWDTPLMGRLSQDWRLVLSNRIDSRFYRGLSRNRNVNSLREAYLTYRLTPRTLIDAGRVNTRYGVALGYNPTDFLGRGTVRSVISADPETLRTNRLGNAMVRLQQFWDKAALTAIVSPKLAGQPSDDGASLDWGASNPRDRLLLVGSYRFAENLNPQLLYFQESHRSPQIGLNLARVLSRSTLAYLEWAGGRQPFAWQTSLPESQWDVAWRNRASAGITWTGENRLTLRLEGHYDGSADNERAMSAFSTASRYGLVQGGASYGNSARQALDLMSPRRSALVQAYWKDVVDQYDLNIIVQRDLQRQKNLGFAELRRHIGPVDVALQWQKIYRMDAETTYQIRPDRRWQISVSYYF